VEENETLVHVGADGGDPSPDQFDRLSL
jgi:hypothetical protein